MQLNNNDFLICFGTKSSSRGQQQYQYIYAIKNTKE